MSTAPKPGHAKATLRFAPSPTGHLHIGNARTALVNWLCARRWNGRFVLRLDDTDHARCEPRFVTSIKDDLEWLGITPDLCVRQSERMGAYEAAADRLREAGLLYACYETPEEIELRRARARAAGRPPIYDRAALRATTRQIESWRGEGRTPHWRFLLPGFDGDPQRREYRHVSWEDACRGTQTVDISSLSDPVLIRADGTFLYTLPSILDDIELGITHVIRGEDHITNTAVQMAIFESLKAAPPVFGHHNLLTRADGQGLSKRTGDLSLHQLRRQGMEALAVAALACLSGSRHAVAPVRCLAALGERLSLTDFSRSPARFDPAELRLLSAKTIHTLPFAKVQDRLHAAGIGGGARFWNVVRANCDTLDEAARWWAIVTGPVEAHIAAEDAALIETASALVPPAPLDSESWKGWTRSISGKTGRAGRALFMALRRALTGLDHGPNMSELLPLIGHEEVMRRLGGRPDRRSAQSTVPMDASQQTENTGY